MKFELNKSCCFTGHRPEKCKGTEEDIRKRLNEEIQIAINDGFSFFITGMALGVDIWAALEVLKIKEEKKDIKLICAVPYEGVEKSRTLELQCTFKEILNKADDVIYICLKQSRKSSLIRNEWMVDHATRVIAVFNGAHGGTEYTIQYAQKNDRDIVLIKDGD